MAEAFKFIHASDLHLDQPMKGIAELPPHLKTTLANAPYDSATRIFDLAIAERVDFVLLAGNLFNIETGGPRASAFLLSQFERLLDKEIEVFWCAGEVDHPDRWPSSIDLPENVTTFSTSIVEDVSFEKGDGVVATIYGVGFDPKRVKQSELITPSNDGFSIALAHGEFDSATLSAPGIQYWALGGRHKSTKLDKTRSVLVYPGSHQGRSPKQSGARGCYVCRVDANEKVRVQSVETDTVRWAPQKVAVAENISEADLKKVLGERARKIASDTTDQVVLASWYLTTTGEFSPSLRKTDLNKRLTDWLRDEFGRGDNIVWTTKLTVEPPNNLPSSWYEEDTILGEYLRAIGRYQSDDSLNLSLHEYMPEGSHADALSGLGRVIKDRRQDVLRKAALLGVEYLGAHKEIADELEPVETTA